MENLRTYYSSLKRGGKREFCISVASVRSGLLEKIASALDVPLSVLYGETFGPVLSIRGSNNTQVAGTSNSVQSDSGLVLELLKMKDEQLLISMKQTCAVQEQMGRLIERICGPEKAEGSGEV